MQKYRQPLPYFGILPANGGADDSLQIVPWTIKNIDNKAYHISLLSN
ncbi:MAG: hypothetical protein IKU79_02950 [Bacteroidaceae bacterium]|nr:hypothetical protein [Bacteroidaceae bacterium]